MQDAKRTALEIRTVLFKSKSIREKLRFKTYAMLIVVWHIVFTGTVTYIITVIQLQSWETGLYRHAYALHYDAVSDMDTVCSFTNHSYFNFSGVKNICNYIVSVGADCYTPVDSSNIPTGDILGRLL